MIVIGEKLNSSIPSTQKAFEERNEQFIKNLAVKQAERGADYLDINAAMLPNEAELLLWAAELAHEAAPDAGITLDSVNPESVAYVLERLELPRLMINSITLEKNRFDSMVRLVKKYNASIIALPITTSEIPDDSEKRVANAKALIQKLENEDISHDRIFIDLLFQAAATDYEAPKAALIAAARLRDEYPNVHLTAGLSNISFGLPKRAYLNNAMLTAGVVAGLDSAIMDITNLDTAMYLAAANLISAQDEYAMGYIETYRELFD
ncbi:MAG: dihydropteroate synthase [Clostridiales bacterium]|jgi:5-methyltetrahydrofolate--homocysteine methyltransferase|nr:dihydropteroate synthase [Clostridiales bacterium]